MSHILHMWFDDFDKMFDDAFKQFMKRKSIFEQFKDTPYYYGYTLKIGADGKPEFKEYGNRDLIGYTSLPDKPDKRTTTTVDEIVNDDEIKFVIEMAGLEKEDIKIEVVDDLLKVEGKRGNREYSEKVPLKYKVEETPKATYKNGILEIVFKKYQPKSHKVDIE